MNKIQRQHGQNLFDRTGGKHDAFEYVDWVVAHKRLLEALWEFCDGGDGGVGQGGREENAGVEYEGRTAMLRIGTKG